MKKKKREKGLKGLFTAGRQTSLDKAIFLKTFRPVQLEIEAPDNCSLSVTDSGQAESESHGEGTTFFFPTYDRSSYNKWRIAKKDMEGSLLFYFLRELQRSVSSLIGGRWALRIGQERTTGSNPVPATRTTDFTAYLNEQVWKAHQQQPNYH